MGVEKTIIHEGNGVDYPKKGDKVAMEYTGWLYDDTKTDMKGAEFDSSVGRGDFNVKIGTSQVIRGWDEGIMGAGEVKGMSLGEKATLVITGDYAYGDRGFPGLIPPHSTLVFDVELKAINNKKA